MKLISFSIKENSKLDVMPSCFNKSNIKRILFSLLLIFSLFILNAPNKLDSILDWKIAIFYPLFIYVIYFNFKIVWKNKVSIFPLFLVGLFFTFTLLWSHNQEYGLTKILYFWLTVFPSTILFLIGVLTANKEDIGHFLLLIIFLGLFLVSIRFMTGSFTFNDSNETNFLFSWSHVGYGRYISYCVLMVFFFLITNHKINFISFVILYFLVFGFYSSGLRGAWLAFLIIASIISIFSIFTISKKNKRRVFIINGFLLLSFVSFYIITFSNNESVLSQRINNLVNINNTMEGIDGSFSARKVAFIVSKEMIKESPLVGRGIGGFNSYFKDYLIQTKIKYPHNFLLELLVEFGILGSLLILCFLLIILSKTKEINNLLVIIFLNTLLLGFFSGHIFYQKMLFVFSVFLTLNQNSKNRFTKAFSNIFN